MMKKFTAILAACAVIFLSSTAFAAYYNEGNDGSSETNAYIIDSLEDITELSSRVNNGTESGDKYYKLTANFTISGDETWNPIGVENNAFTGHFDGNNQTLTMNINNPAYRASLFGLIKTSQGYAVKNLNINGTIQGKFAAPVASVIDYGTETYIENCSFTGNLKSEYHYSSFDSVSDNHTSAGGIVEVVQSGTVRNCKVYNASITSTQSQDKVSAYAGGIAAAMGGGFIQSCSVKAEIYAEGTDAYTGGIVGNSKYGRVSYCEFNGGFHTNGYQGGVVGKMEEGENDNGEVYVIGNKVTTSLKSADLISNGSWGAVAGYITNSIGALELNSADINIPEAMQNFENEITNLTIGTNNLTDDLKLLLSVLSNDIKIIVEHQVNGGVEVSSGGCNFGLSILALTGLFVFLRRK